MKIGIIGTGRVARSIGHGWQQTGHSVAYGSRDPVQVEIDGTVGGFGEAVHEAEVVVCAVPGRVAVETLRTIGAPALAGKILVDVGNALNDRFELIYPNASLGATIQAELPHSLVVKTLNTVTAPLMSSPNSLPPTQVFLSGDDPASKAVVSGLLGDLGWTREARIDLGGIATARATEHYIFLSMSLMRVLGTTSYGLHIQHNR